MGRSGFTTGKVKWKVIAGGRPYIRDLDALWAYEIKASG
jgi:hypothetical protein